MTAAEVQKKALARVAELLPGAAGAVADTVHAHRERPEPADDERSPEGDGVAIEDR